MNEIVDKSNIIEVEKKAEHDSDEEPTTKPKNEEEQKYHESVI